MHCERVVPGMHIGTISSHPHISTIQHDSSSVKQKYYIYLILREYYTNEVPNHFLYITISQYYDIMTVEKDSFISVQIG